MFQDLKWEVILQNHARRFLLQIWLHEGKQGAHLNKATHAEYYFAFEQETFGWLVFFCK